jgi:hypothetical protein
MATASLGTWLTSFRDALAARPGLSGVEVLIVAKDETVRDKIILMRGDELRRLGEWAAVGNLRHEDDFEIPFRVITYAAASKDADVNVATALDRADLYLAEIFDELKTNTPAAGDQTTNALISDRDYRLTIADRGGWLAIVDFVVTIESRAS